MATSQHRCVFVGNIPYDATEEQLIQICEEVGPVVSFRDLKNAKEDLGKNCVALYEASSGDGSLNDDGGYDKEDKAARAYDLAALKYWGTTTTTNFPKFCPTPCVCYEAALFLVANSLVKVEVMCKRD